MKAARLSPVEQSNPQPPRAHQLSPSAWNRYETCPRMYWLSRQRLPRKAGMAASLGTAVHASIEDLLNMDLDGRSADETGWLPLTAEGFLKTRWDEEKAAFMATPRRPDWKDAKWSEAKKQQKGGIVLLLDHIGAKHLGHEQITVALWRHLQSLTIAVEGELVTSDGRLMGRLDLLFADVDDAGQLQGWLVADLKTGNAPTEALKPEVNRQLRMYRDILLANNPTAPPVRTEGWYTKTATKWTAEGRKRARTSLRSVGSHAADHDANGPDARPKQLRRFLRLESAVPSLVDLAPRLGHPPSRRLLRRRRALASLRSNLRRCGTRVV